MAHGQTHILNDSITVDDETKGDLDTVDKNIRVLITKLKGAHMNEGEYEYDIVAPHCNDEDDARRLPSGLPADGGQRAVHRVLSTSGKIKIHATRNFLRRQGVYPYLISSLEIIFVTFNNCLEESVLHQHLQQSHNPRNGSPGQRWRGTHTQGGKM